MALIDQKGVQRVVESLTGRWLAEGEEREEEGVVCHLAQPLRKQHKKGGAVVGASHKAVAMDSNPVGTNAAENNGLADRRRGNDASK